MEFDQKNIEDKSDSDLVALSLENQSNFLYLVRRYEAKLLRYIFRISSFNLEEAEDILQEVFLKVYKNLNDFDQNLKFSSWIYRITHNQVISHFRQGKIRPRPTEITEDIAAKIKAEFDINDELNQGYLNHDINKIFDNLKDSYREILILRFFEDRSYEEISEILKKPAGSVATLLRSAKKDFKKAWLEKKYEF